MTERPPAEMLLELVRALRADLAERRQPLAAELGEESRKLIAQMIAALDVNTEQHRLQTESQERLVMALRNRLDEEIGATPQTLTPSPN